MSLKQSLLSLLADDEDELPVPARPTLHSLLADDEDEVTGDTTKWNVTEGDHKMNPKPLTYAQAKILWTQKARDGYNVRLSKIAG